MTLLHWLSDRRLWMAAALAVAALIAWGSLTPGDEMPQNLPWDKFNHFAGYGVLALCGGLTGMRIVPAWLLAAGYGVVIEFAQSAVPGRLGGDPADMLANALGAALALALLGLARCLAGRRAGRQGR